MSVLLHSLLLLVVIEGRLPQVPERRPSLIPLPEPLPSPDRQVAIPAFRPRPDRTPGPTEVAAPPRPELVVDTARLSAPALIPIRPDTIIPPARVPVAGRIGPGPGDGRLWVRPLPLPPRDLARRLEPSHEELLDSAVTAIVQQYLDSIAREPGADEVKLPDWTTRVAGSKFGLDSRNIYIAGLKIPAAVLALLPLPAGGNQANALDHNGRVIAEDLRRAAMRSATVEEFKQAVRELRKEKQRQKDLERAQRERPDTTQP